MRGEHRTGYDQRRKELRYLKATIPGYTTKRPAAETKAHIEMLMSYGWSGAEIERKSGAGKSVVSDILLGKQHSLHVDTEAAILGVKLTPLDHETGPGLTVEGRRLGAHRIVAGLAASGWTYAAITSHAPGWGAECLRRYGQRPKIRNSSQISKERYLELRDLAARLETMDPVQDGGAPVKFSRAARAKAVAKGYPPLSCWDLESVHLPESIPEWTGACGTPEGYAIHLRERIKICQPCADATRGEERTGGVFSPTKFRIMMEQRGFSSRELAERIDATDDSVRRWAGGERRPKGHFLTNILSALDCHLDELTDRDGEDVYHDIDFNRHAFKAAMEARGKSIRGLAIEIGISNMAVHYWCNGKNIPKIPKIVKAAEILGVDWQEFYR